MAKSINAVEDALKAIVRLLVAVCVAFSLAGALGAQTYPDKPVKIVVPFAPAGPTDVIARIVADKLSASLGKQFYIENRAGAGGNTGTAAVATSPADGYTLIVVSTGFVVNPSLFAKVPYDPVKDFAPISIVAVSPNVMTVHPSVPAKTVQELIALIKANPGKYSFAAPGVGSTPHLSGEIFRMSQGIDMVTVQFTGAGPAIQNTVGGHTPIAFTAMPPAAPQIKEGTLRALVVTSEKRAPGFPDVPTAAEAGLAGQEAYTLTGMLAPAGTPKEIIALLHGEIVKIVAMTDVQKRLDDLGFEVVANTPAQFAERITTEMEKWGKVVREAKLKIDSPVTAAAFGCLAENDKGGPRAALYMRAAFVALFDRGVLCLGASALNRRFRRRGVIIIPEQVERRPAVAVAARWLGRDTGRPEPLEGHRDLGADVDARIEVQHILVVHADAALGDGRTDGPGRVGAVDAIHARSEVERADAQRVHGMAARHPARQARVLGHHGGRRRPGGIDALLGHAGRALPPALLARRGNGVADGLSGAVT